MILNYLLVNLFALQNELKKSHWAYYTYYNKSGKIWLFLLIQIFFL